MQLLVEFFNIFFVPLPEYLHNKLSPRVRARGGPISRLRSRRTSPNPSCLSLSGRRHIDGGSSSNLCICICISMSEAFFRSFLHCFCSVLFCCCSCCCSKRNGHFLNAESIFYVQHTSATTATRQDGLTTWNAKPFNQSEEGSGKPLPSSQRTLFMFVFTISLHEIDQCIISILNRRKK